MSKSQRLTAGIAVAALLGLGGCRSVSLEPVRDEHSYVLEALILRTSTAGYAMLERDLEGNIGRVVARRDTELVRFPALVLTPAQEVAVDQQRDAVYRGPGGADRSVRVGTLIAARMRGIDGAKMGLDIAVKWAEIIGWSKHGKGLRLPVTSSASMETTLMVGLGRWRVAGEMHPSHLSREHKDTGVRLVLVRVNAPVQEGP